MPENLGKGGALANVKRSKIIWLLMVVLCLLSAFPAGAARTSELRILVEDICGLTVRVYPVADPYGNLNEQFEGADLSPEQLLDEKRTAENAEALLKHAEQNGWGGYETVTDDKGVTVYRGLTDGCYLVSTSGESSCFAPFLVYVPTIINGESMYNITAEPKTGNVPDVPDIPDHPNIPDVPDIPDIPETPEDPVAPAPPDVPYGPAIPQTGVNALPKYLLLALGTVCIVVGFAELLLSRKDKYE